MDESKNVQTTPTRTYCKRRRPLPCYCRGVLLIWITVGQGPIVLAVGAGGGLFGHFYSHLSFLSPFLLSLENGPIQTKILSQRAVKPKTTNQPTLALL